MRTTGQHRRTPKIGRRLAATASLAAFATVGAAIGASTPAFAGTSPSPSPLGSAATSSPLGLATPSPLGSAATGAANATGTAATTATSAVTAVTPIVKLAANHASVTAGHVVEFTVTEKTPAGVAVPSEPATFYMHTIHGWIVVATKKMSTAGSATFTAKPNYDHAYRVDFPSVTVDGVNVYNAVRTADVTVAAKPVDIGPEIVAAAAKEKGKRYVFGAAGPNTFDCSGLTKYVFAKFGIDLPHKANLQKNYGTRVSEKDAKPGDLVFVFDGSYAHHVAIYAGNGTWWEAPHTGASVRHVKIWSSDIEFRRVR